MIKYEWKKEEKNVYEPKVKPVFIEVPEYSYLVIEGKGNPNSEEFSKDVEALYKMAYTIRMSYKKSYAPDNYYEYTVFPLEGVWDIDENDYRDGKIDKNKLKYRIMIRQPDFFNDKLFNEAKKDALKSKGNIINKIIVERSKKETCCQILHVGPYDTENESFDKITEFLVENGFKRTQKSHREIYLSDPRKTQKEKMKTTLRVRVEKI